MTSQWICGGSRCKKKTAEIRRSFYLRRRLARFAGQQLYEQPDQEYDGTNDRDEHHEEPDQEVSDPLIRAGHSLLRILEGLTRVPGIRRGCRVRQEVRKHRLVVDRDRGIGCAILQVI